VIRTLSINGWRNKVKVHLRPVKGEISVYSIIVTCPIYKCSYMSSTNRIISNQSNKAIENIKIMFTSLRSYKKQKSWLQCHKNTGLGLWYLTPLSTIFHYIVAVHFIGRGNRYCDLLQVTDKLYHIKLHRLYRLHLAMSGILTHNFSGDRH